MICYKRGRGKRSKSWRRKVNLVLSRTLGLPNSMSWKRANSLLLYFLGLIKNDFINIL